MAAKKEPDPVAAALGGLQRMVRDGEAISPAESAMTISIEDDIATPDARTLLMGPLEVEAFRRAKATIEGDLRFEHLGGLIGDPLQRQLIRLVSLCAVERDQDQGAKFAAEHERDPEHRTCFLGVEFLQVKEPVELFGLRLLPTDHGDIPPATHWFSIDPPVGSVLAVPSTGTHLTRMKDRAAVTAERALRALRVALGGDRPSNPLQLRFRLSESYSFGGQMAGWKTSPDARWSLTLDSGLIGLAAGSPIAELAREPTNDLERHAARAMAWIEDSMIEGDPMKSLLFSFFALEAMIGVRSEGLKAHGLAYRRALLSHAIRGSFPDPDQVYLLYDEVRSAVVHGEAPPDVPDTDRRTFQWDVGVALGEYLQLARRERLETRRALLKYLRRLPDREQLDKWLNEFGGDSWRRYLASEGSPDDRAAADTAKALSHPVRLAYLRALRELGPSGLLSPSEHSRVTGEPLGKVSYHVKALARAGVLEIGETVARRGAREHRYALRGPRARASIAAMDVLART
jgi:DNA-binding transcriptional ArsR family regulator